MQSKGERMLAYNAINRLNFQLELTKNDIIRLITVYSVRFYTRIQDRTRPTLRNPAAMNIALAMIVFKREIVSMIDEQCERLAGCAPFYTRCTYTDKTHDLPAYTRFHYGHSGWNNYERNYAIAAAFEIRPRQFSPRPFGYTKCTFTSSIARSAPSPDAPGSRLN